MDGAEKVDAYVSRETGNVKVHIGSLTLEIVVDDSNAGPLGHENGQNPGVIFWESSYVKIDGQSFEHGQQKPIHSVEMPEFDAKKMENLILEHAQRGDR